MATRTCYDCKHLIDERGCTDITGIWGWVECAHEQFENIDAEDDSLRPLDDVAQGCPHFEDGENDFKAWIPQRRD